MEAKLSMGPKVITADMTNGEVVAEYPSLAEVLTAEGVHCVGCGASYSETIQEGLMGHGLSEQEVEAVVERLNAAIPKEEGSAGQLVVTEKAAKKLKEFLAHQKKNGHGLRITIVKGGCAGYSYDFSIEPAAKNGDIQIEVDGVNFFIDGAALPLLKGARIDYVDSLTGAGFRITNPNAQKS